jgi:cyclophilin family peptidyl-prolyl cis-trans isomerase
MRFRLIIYLFFISSLTGFAQSKSKKDYVFTIKTNFGEMHAILYDEAPKHKENFLKLVESKFYDDLLFHRIIKNFMIQGGDPNSRNAPADKMLGDGGGDLQKTKYEFNPKNIHKRGALAAAHDGNPEKASSKCQFFIVDGKKYDAQELAMVQSRNKMNYTDEQKKVYQELGGAAHLDNNYTVFGEIIDGFEVLDTIANQERNNLNRPKQDVKMVISVKKLRKKKITKKYHYVYL